MGVVNFFMCAVKSSVTLSFVLRGLETWMVCTCSRADIVCNYSQIFSSLPVSPACQLFSNDLVKRWDVSFIFSQRWVSFGIKGMVWFCFIYESFTLVIPHYWINYLIFLQLMAHMVWELLVGLVKCHFSNHQDELRITFRITSFWVCGIWLGTKSAVLEPSGNE